MSSGSAILEASLSRVDRRLASISRAHPGIASWRRQSVAFAFLFPFALTMVAGLLIGTLFLRAPMKVTLAFGGILSWLGGAAAAAMISRRNRVKEEYERLSMERARLQTELTAREWSARPDTAFPELAIVTPRPQTPIGASAKIVQSGIPANIGLRCWYHDNQPAGGVCTGCGRAICKACADSTENRLRCVHCAEHERSLSEAARRRAVDRRRRHRLEELDKKETLCRNNFLLSVFGVAVAGGLAVLAYSATKGELDYHVVFLGGIASLAVVGAVVAVIQSTQVAADRRVLESQGDIESEHSFETSVLEDQRPSHSPQRAGNVLDAMALMFLVSLLLFWLPLFGPIIAGLVGGKKAGSVGRALVAVFLPVLFSGGLIFIFFSSITKLPVIGLAAGLGSVAFALVHVGPLLLGAIIGGLMSR